MPDKLYIDGAWIASTGTGTIEVINSTDETVMGTVPEGTPEDVDKAVAAARRAFPEWSATPPAERSKFLQRIAEGLNARSDELTNTIVGEVGAMPAMLARIIQVGLPVGTFMSMAALASDLQLEEEVGNSLIVREPVGVVGCITPWNYPLHQIAAKVAAAWAAGCTVVVKPSEVAPLNAWVLAEVIDEVGLPAGVFNLVSGRGPVVGEAIASHPDVDMVSFTGSTRAGKRVAELASGTVKRVALELGGKSPNVILDDADLSTAVRAGVNNAYLNAGQTCSALTRMLVPRDKLAEAEQIAVEAAESFTTGDPRADGVKLGPLVSSVQRDRVRDLIRAGIDEGADLLTGGAEAPEGLDSGFFVRPTVFSNVRPDMRIAQEEIFGPVLSIIPYDGEDEAIEIANDTLYGLAAGVWSADADRALRVGRQLRAGQVEVNGGSFNPVAPFGGYKQSGYGREYGKYGIDEFLEVKSLQR